MPIARVSRYGEESHMFSRFLNVTAGIMLFCLIPAMLAARPMTEDLYLRLIEEGRLEEVVSRLQDARARGCFNSEKTYDVKIQLPSVMGKTTASTVDTMWIPVILIDFSDNSFMDYPNIYDANDYDSVLFSEGLMQFGSMTEFYLENSYGSFHVAGDVVGWYRMPQTYAYYVDGQQGYGTYPQNVKKMVEDAISAADPSLDFSKYDNDDNGWVDGIAVIHAGYDAAETGSDDMIWSHRWSISAQMRDDVMLSSYAIQPAIRYYDDRIIGIGVFCHEWGHVLGLPDLYDTDYSSVGAGYWTAMASGANLGGGDVPAHFDPWCKMELGFSQPLDLAVNTTGVEFPRAEETPLVYRLAKHGSVGAQYFLVENRQLVSFDTYLPTGGMLIWHVDETRSGNDYEPRYLVAVEQADGEFDLELTPGGGADRGDDGDPWPGFTNKREFHDLTVPDSRDYYSSPTEVGVFNISDSESLMTADLEVFFSRPYVVRDTFDFGDALGNDNHRADPGESDVELLITITNLWADAQNLTMQVSTDYPEIVFADDESFYGELLQGVQADNTGDLITFSVDAGFPPTIVDFELAYTADGGYAHTETLTVDVGPPQVVVVDDDEAVHLEYEEYFARILD
ncbi:M6 family metalloprotease domain-containing protein [Candidatus Zixiibacteriota bacterium]